MTRRPVTVAPDATVAAARSAMRRGRFRHLPVVAAAELVGVVAAGDLQVPPGAPVEAAEELAERPLTEVMSAQPITVWPDEPVEVAARLLVDHDVGCLPVLAEQGLVGILTESNLLSVVTAAGPEPGTREVVLRAGTINAAPVVAALVAAGFPATGPGRPGAPGRPGR